MREGQRRAGQFICVDCRPSKIPRLGITASTKYGNAPERNRFKRLVREAFRLSALPSLELNVVPRKLAKKATLSEIRNELMQLCN